MGWLRVPINLCLSYTGGLCVFYEPCPNNALLFPFLYIIINHGKVLISVRNCSAFESTQMLYSRLVCSCADGVVGHPLLSSTVSERLFTCLKDYIIVLQDGADHLVLVLCIILVLIDHDEWFFTIHKLSPIAKIMIHAGPVDPYQPAKILNSKLTTGYVPSTLH